MQTHEVDITDLSHDGRGVAHVDGKAVFVIGGLPGERAVVRIAAHHRNFDEARIETLLNRSPDRVEPRCPHFGTCGGCALQHLAPAAQIAESSACWPRTSSASARSSPRAGSSR